MRVLTAPDPFTGVSAGRQQTRRKESDKQKLIADYGGRCRDLERRKEKMEPSTLESGGLGEREWERPRCPWGKKNRMRKKFRKKRKTSWRTSGSTRTR